MELFFFSLASCFLSPKALFYQDPFRRPVIKKQIRFIFEGMLTNGIPGGRSWKIKRHLMRVMPLFKRGVIVFFYIRHGVDIQSGAVEHLGEDVLAFKWGGSPF